MTRVGIGRVVEGDGLARSDPPLRRGRRATTSPGSSEPACVHGTGRPWALHWAMAAHPGRRVRWPESAGWPSTQVTVWRRTSVGVGGLGRSDGDPPGRDVDGGHEPSAAVGPVSHAPPLPHGDQLHGVDRAEVGPGAVVDHPAGMRAGAGRPGIPGAPGRSG